MKNRMFHDLLKSQHRAIEGCRMFAGHLSIIQTYPSLWTCLVEIVLPVIVNCRRISARHGHHHMSRVLTIYIDIYIHPPRKKHTFLTCSIFRVTCFFFISLVISSDIQGRRFTGVPPCSSGPFPQGHSRKRDLGIGLCDQSTSRLSWCSCLPMLRKKKTVWISLNLMVQCLRKFAYPKSSEIHPSLLYRTPARITHIISPTYHPCRGCQIWNEPFTRNQFNRNQMLS